MSTSEGIAEVDLIGHATEPERYRQDGDGETTFMSVAPFFTGKFNANGSIPGRLIRPMSLLSQLPCELHQNSMHQRQCPGQAPV